MTPIALEEVPEKDKKKYYWIWVECENCGLQAALAFEKGQKINQHKCPKCECKTLHREIERLSAQNL